MFGIIVKVTEMEKDTNLSLSKLFHYTYSIDNLLGILKDGFKIKYSLEKLGLFDNEENNLTDEFAIPMICFCDIPLNLVKQHISVYGNFAIGLKKEWGEKQAICPIIYLPKYGETKVLLENAVRNINKNNNKIREIKNSLTNINQEMTMIDVINFYDDFIDFTMYVKPYIGNFERKTIGFNDPNYKFYDEREWRYKPNKRLCQSYMSKETFLSFSSSEERDKYLKVISFEKEDITDIVVPNENIENVRNEIKKIAKFKDMDPNIIDSIENRIKNYSA